MINRGEKRARGWEMSDFGKFTKGMDSSMALTKISFLKQQHIPILTCYRD